MKLFRSIQFFVTGWSLTWNTLNGQVALRPDVTVMDPRKQRRRSFRPNYSHPPKSGFWRGGDLLSHRVLLFPFRRDIPSPAGRCRGQGLVGVEYREHTKQRYEQGKWKWKRDVSNSSKSEAFSTSIWSTKVDRYCPYNESRSWSMESQEGRNSDQSDASSAKYDIQVGPTKNRFFFPAGRNGVLPGNHGFLSFRHWLLVEPLEWNDTGISGDLSSLLTRERLSLCALPNGVIVLFCPLSSTSCSVNSNSFGYLL